MRLVLTHNNMDFDGLSAQYAVTKLYPGTLIIPGYPLVGNVREFLSLYRDSLPLGQLRYINSSNVSHIYIVDCQHINRLDETAKQWFLEPDRKFKYSIFDHHGHDPDGLAAHAEADSVYRPLGSTTSILVDVMRKKKVKLTPFEATLLLIGIYEDTGSLTFAQTTDVDAECVAYLLRSGADVIRVGEYLHHRLNDQQVKLLEVLIQNSKAINVSGAKVVVCHSSLPAYLDGLASLTRKLLEVEAADAVLSCVHMKDRVHLVGRSDHRSIDVRQILKRFGGEGHPGAASAVVKHKSVEEVLALLEEMLENYQLPEVLAQDIMQTPVQTILPKTTMEEAGRTMLRYGLDGLVVAENSEVLGVVSRRDIDQATHHKLQHAPVQGFMSRPVITIDPKTTLSNIQAKMISEDIGRLPVVSSDGHLLGIVTRREVLKTLYGDQSERDYKADFAQSDQEVSNFCEKLEQQPDSIKWLFNQIGLIAAKKNMRVYVVGGFVRDLILSKGNYDLDFVIEGNAIELANALAEAFPGRFQVKATHERFQTACVLFNNGDGLEVDLSTARTEYYEFPAALPTVEASSIKQDMFRRDFTINAMAICLNPGHYGEIVDYFGGLKDIKQKLIRVLHPFSFIEDPTRLIRAARFAARFDFKLESRTRAQAERAISMGIFDNLGGFRMKSEIRLILESPTCMQALTILGELGGRLRYLDTELVFSKYVQGLLYRGERLLKRFSVDEPWIVYLGILLSQLDRVKREDVLERLHLTNKQSEMINRGIDAINDFPDVDRDLKRSEIHSILHGLSDQSLAIAASIARPGSPWRRMIRLYLEELKDITLELKGADLLRMGYRQGSNLGTTLNLLLEMKLDGKLRTKSDVVEMAKKILPV